MPSEVKAKKSPWLWVFLALGLLLAGLSASGRLETYSPVFLENSSLFLMLACLALFPGLAYAWILKRGKPAPLLRLPYAPFFLILLAQISIQLSGGFKSPLLAAVPLLLFEITPFVSLNLACAVATMALLMDLPAFLREPFSIENALALVLPWLGLLLSRMLAGSFEEVKTAQPSQKAEAEASSLQELPELDPAALLKRSLSQWMDLAFHAHPSWNTVLLLWAEDGRLHPKEARSRGGAETLNLEFSVSEGEGVLGLLLRDKKRLDVPNLSVSTAAALPYYRSQAPVAALLALPFFDEGILLGALVVDRLKPGEWSLDESSALEALGLQVAQQSQQANYLGRMQDRGRQVSTLYHVAKELSSDLDMTALLKRIPELLKSILPFDSYYLALRNPDASSFAIATQQGYREDYCGAYQLDENTGLGGWVLTSGEPVVFNSGSSEAVIPVFLSEGLEAEASSFLLIPLMLSGRVTGLLKLDRLSEAGFSEAERELTLIFAAQAAVTLEHARLYGLHQRLATTDGLTGLYNHRYFQERLAVEIEAAARLEKPLALALTDIDFFKKFNDDFGHQEGDQVLKKTAKMLRDSVRQDQDIVCRYGGEEFVVIMPDCDLVQAREIAERIRGNCAENLKGGHGDEARAITLSIGLCVYPLGAKEQRQIILLADEALYKAKQTGRNKVCSFKDLP